MATYGYVRVSTDEQGADDRTSLDTQARKIAGLADVGGWPVDRMFVESGVSGGTPLRERPEGAVLWSLLQPGDRLIAAKLDRLFRSASDALAIADELNKRGVKLHLLDMGLDAVNGDGVARFFFGVLALVAQFERDRIKERQREGQHAKRRNGGHIGGMVPFGYVKLGEGRGATLQPHPAQQEAIQVMVAMRAQGETLRAISKHLDTCRGIKVSFKTVGAVLAREQNGQPHG